MECSRSERLGVFEMIEITSRPEIQEGGRLNGEEEEGG
jgi:hypothetical protein